MGFDVTLTLNFLGTVRARVNEVVEILGFQVELVVAIRARKGRRIMGSGMLLHRIRLTLRHSTMKTLKTFGFVNTIGNIFPLPTTRAFSFRELWEWRRFHVFALFATTRFGDTKHC